MSDLSLTTSFASSGCGRLFNVVYSRGAGCSLVFDAHTSPCIPFEKIPLGACECGKVFLQLASYCPTNLAHLLRYLVCDFIVLQRPISMSDSCLVTSFLVEAPGCWCKQRGGLEPSRHTHTHIFAAAVSRYSLVPPRAWYRIVGSCLICLALPIGTHLLRLGVCDVY